MTKKRGLGFISLLLTLCLMLPGAALAKPADVVFSGNGTTAYIGDGNRLYLSGGSQAFTDEAVSQIIYADESAVYYQSADENLEGAYKLSRLMLDGLGTVVLASGIQGRAQTLGDGNFYYMNAAQPGQLMRVDLNGQATALATTSYPDGELGVCAQGLCYAVEIDGALNTMVYDAETNQFSGADFAYNDRYDLFDGLETMRQADEFKIRLNGSSDWVTMDNGVVACTQMNGLLYYMKNTGSGMQIQEYDPIAKQKRTLCTLAPDFLPQLVGADGLLYVITQDKKVNYISVSDGSVTLMPAMDGILVDNPIIQLADGKLLVYEDAEQEGGALSYRGYLLTSGAVPADSSADIDVESGETPLPEETPAPEETLEPEDEEPEEEPEETPEPEDEDEEEGYIGLSRGDSGSRVERLQQRLKDLGYPVGYVDGIYGEQTVEAVSLFQKAIGYEQTGAAGPKMQARLFASNAPKYDADSAYIELKRGDTGAEVKKLQKRLKQLGYFDGEIGGNYLDLTTAAVKRFQKQIGWKQTGVATVALQKKLFSSSAPKYEGESDSGYVELKKGDTGASVKKLQKRLKQLGYFNGDIGGNYLSQTTAAVKLFQKQIGWKQTGVATVALQKKLFSSSAPEFTGDAGTSYVELAPGDTGERVKKLQRRLKELGYFDGDIGGNYLTKTTAAVKLFQKQIGWKQTGIANVGLQKKLFSSSAPSYNG